MYDVNVTGTRNVLAACVAHRIPRLVYTSTASVVFAGRDLDGVDEAAPVPPRGAFLDYYTSTKAEAEAAVRAANGVGGVSTVCLRPSGIFGEYDRYFFPSIVEWDAGMGRRRCGIAGLCDGLTDAAFGLTTHGCHTEADSGPPWRWQRR